MPTYEYRCSNCGAALEEFQKMSDAPLVTCPTCGQETLNRIVSGGAGVLYKGEGWYVTDYSKKSSGGKEAPAATTTDKQEKSDKPAAPVSSPSETTPKTPAPTKPATKE
jgi:putative FmdB family regulatory protein